MIPAGDKDPLSTPQHNAGAALNVRLNCMKRDSKGGRSDSIFGRAPCCVFQQFAHSRTNREFGFRLCRRLSGHDPDFRVLFV
jgi:hypothetical protein